MNSISAQEVLWSENFSSWTINSTGNWTIIDGNNDSRNWSGFNTGAAQGFAAKSDSWNQTPISPNNYMISPAITLAEGTESAFLTWKAWAHTANYPAENYSVYIVTENTIEAINASPVAFNEVLSSSQIISNPSMPVIDVSSFTSEPFYIVFRHHDCFDEWSLYIDDLSIFQPPLVDVELNAVSVEDYISSESTDFNFNLSTMSSGASLINNILVQVTTENFSESILVEFEDPISIGNSVMKMVTIENEFTIGNKDLTVELLEVNGEAYEVGNTLDTEFLVVNQLYNKIPLAENFSSSTCPPCSGANTFLFAPVYTSYSVNFPESNLNAVKYQVRIPTGGDPSVNPHSLGRSSFYAVNSAPSVFLDGKPFDPFAAPVNTWAEVIPFYEEAIESQRLKPAPFEITGNYSLNASDELTVNLTVTPGYDVPASKYRVYVSVNNIEYNFAGTNGESTFKQVNRRMLPNQNGSLFPVTNYGSSAEFTFTQNFNVGGVTDGNHNLWNRNISVVAWVQRISDKSIMNSFALFEGTTNINETSLFKNLSLFPNPTENEAQLNFNLTNQQPINIEVYDLTGKKVYAQNLGLSVGEINHTIKMQNQSNGLYLVRIIAGSETTTLRLVKN